MFYKSPTTDLIIVLVIVLLIFGPKRLPGLGKQLGQGMREFKESITGQNKDDEAPPRPELTAASGSASGAAPGTSSGERESAEVRSQPRA
ncbi:MAG: twin-arginine translocase TatA/TatE family subunit [Solirubrobacterales bacterium]|nr:twin-arginine translocase TatA/TatE family subunit [Solirubrobacterales bacterium]MBV9683905.1 twin-arginine translocase TatA/TatE family subunit [Solirubrobacterales bacterium]MBV9805551.1 twin-arginine translocase TatA/TatE family subunit [Solirubrobacterales bacterium]